MSDDRTEKSLAQGKLIYTPNPAHKVTTTEAGPPKWQPDKTACPTDITPDEIRLMCWLTRKHPDGRVEIHGYPIDPERERIPPRVLRQFRDRGRISSNAEYRRLV